MLATSSRRRPLGRTIVHVAIVLAASAFGVLAGAGGYWAVPLDRAVAFPVRPAVIAASKDRTAR